MRCLRNTIHTNLMFTYVLADFMWILSLTVKSGPRVSTLSQLHSAPPVHSTPIKGFFDSFFPPFSWSFLWLPSLPSYLKGSPGCFQPFADMSKPPKTEVGCPFDLISTLTVEKQRLAFIMNAVEN
ncbi:unnamed protein product [Nezara viridula]|uniref:Uncharacterized protein n=1 Tax=Nezara viridula TaxID=85310 RepID=A0A9P0H707_NEZVI|nr:unnamed protein product [Nezara viridula]